MMNMGPKEEILLELGLSRNEAKVYTSLLREGVCNISSLAKRCVIHRANVYESLERLKNKGLLSETIQNSKRILQVAEPAALATLLREKELRLKEVLPQFQIDYQMSQKQEMVEVYNGSGAIRNMLTRSLEKGGNIYAFGIPKSIMGLIGEYFLKNIHKTRAKKKQWMYHIYNSDACERAKYLNTLPYTQARSLSPEFDCPVVTLICGDEVYIMSLNSNPIVVVRINNKEMAEVYCKYFQILWEKTKEPT